MDWNIYLTGDKNLLARISKSLTNPNMQVVRENDEFKLKSSAWAVMTLGEVHGDGERLVGLLNGIARLELGAVTPLACGRIVNVRPDGVEDQYVVVPTLKLTLTTFAPSVNEQPRDDLRESISTALGDSEAETVLRLYGTGDIDWVNLYRIYEVIETAIGGQAVLVSKGWLTAGRISLFKHTANSIGAVGDQARHGKELTTAPKTPMTLVEAKQLIQSLAKAWLRSKP